MERQKEREREGDKKLILLKERGLVHVLTGLWSTIFLSDRTSYIDTETHLNHA